MPLPVYRAILQRYKEPVADLLEIRDTRISIEKFERIAKQAGYKIDHRLHYLINPIYEWKFGWHAKAQLPVLRDIPYIRNYFTTCVYYLIKPLQA